MMTTDLTKTFFDTFGIEPKLPDYNEGYCDGCQIDNDKCESNCPHKAQITDRILLQLFDILRATYNIDFWSIDESFVMDLRDKQASYTNIIYRTGGDFKNSILSSLNLIVKDKLIGNDKIKRQVQALFEEGLR